MIKPKLLHFHGKGVHVTHNGGMVPNNTREWNGNHTSYNPSTMPKIIQWHGVLTCKQTIQSK